MKPSFHITTLFVAVGGILLTNGWDRHSREAAAAKFHIDFNEMEGRHKLTFDTYEIGKITLEEYVNRIVFYEKRNFSVSRFIDFMYTQSQVYDDMMQLIVALKTHYKLKVAVVSNEGKELTEYRIRTFNLTQAADFFVSSGFVHLRKPDPDIYRLALDLAQTPLENILYLDDRKMFIEVAAQLGIKGLHHVSYASTKAQMESYGLLMK